ncbi:MAG: hypothetical protein ABTQ34_00295 [Bdellovibrionales bacterium]
MRILGKTERKLAWLAEEIAKRRDRAAKLVRRIEAIEPWVGEAAPGLREKFVRYLYEVANEREEEGRLLSRVEAIEKRHHDRRQRGRLSYARGHRLPRGNPALRAIAVANRNEARAASAARKQKDFLLLLIVFWYLFVRKSRLFSRKPDNMAPR